MSHISSYLDRLFGKAFEIHCLRIEVRGQSDHAKPYFRGAGSIIGDVSGGLQFRVYHLARLHPLVWKQLQEGLRNGVEALRVFATDLDGTEWTGSWCLKVDLRLSNQGRCLVSGELDQLSARLPLTVFEEERNLTAIHYTNAPRLPMLSGAQVQTVRDGQVEETRYLYDLCELDFEEAKVIISSDEANRTLKVSCTHRTGWFPPFCEVGLADAISFVAATVLYPRVAVRYFEKDALFFLRRTPIQTQQSGLPPIASGPPVGSAIAVWELFLAFLKDCEHHQKFESTPLARAFHEVVLASTGTVHGLVLTLVAAIEDLTNQIVGKAVDPEKSKTKSCLSDFKKYVQNWCGEEDFKKRVLSILQSSLLATPTKKHLEGLAKERVVTEAQIKIWAELRPKLAHGNIIDYADVQLAEKRHALISMFYNLARRILKCPAPPTRLPVPSNRCDKENAESASHGRLDGGYSQT